MNSRRAFATVALLLWLAMVALAHGPGRWALGPGYALLIDGSLDALPQLTASLSLPVLGIGPGSNATMLVSAAFWGWAWLGPLALLLATWRARDERRLLDCLVYGGAVYGAGLALAVFAVILGLLLPFVPIF